MISIGLSLLAIFLILVLSEYLTSRKILKGEFGRKFIHITVGTFVAFWPFYMSFTAIQLISLAFLVIVLISKKYNIFSTIHTVDRKSWGEPLFAIGIGLTSLLTDSPWIFAAAILQLSLADGLAAIIGKKYGQKHQYKVFGFTKTYAGTAAFWVTSVLIFMFVLSFGTDTTQFVVLPIIFWLPVVATIAENIGVYGTDNIIIPILITIALNRLQFGL